MLRTHVCTLSGVLVAIAAATASGQIVGEVLNRDAVQLAGDGMEEHFGLPADMPPLDQIPPAPMPMFDGMPGFDPNAPSAVTIFDAETGRATVLPARFGTQPSGEGGMVYGGEDGGVAGFQDRSFGTMMDTTESAFPARVNCKVAMRFTTTTGGTAWYVCSGTLIDAETVMLAAHCIYNRDANISAFADEVFVFPGWDGNGDVTPGTSSAGVMNHYGYGRATQYIAGSNYVNNGDWDADMAHVRLTRAVGMLTGWHGYAWGQSCGTIQDRSYYNYSFPTEGCGTPGLHTGTDMKYWDGTIDSCPGNQMQLDTTPGCFTAVWGGQSGSGMYYISNGNRYNHAVCSTSNRSTVGRWNKLWETYKNDMVDFIANTRTSTFDLQALDCNFGPPSIAAGESTTTANFLATNPTNADPGNATYTYRIYLSANLDISTSDTLLATRSFTWDFGPMSSVRVNTGNVIIPESATTGARYIGVIIDSAEDSVPANNDTDEWDAQAVTITAPIPDNNACSPGFNLPFETTVAGSNVGASNDGTTNCGGTTTNHDDVWYRFVAPYDGTYIVETLSGGTLADTVLSVHSACPGTAANTIVCDDDSGTLNLSRLTFDGNAGTTYRVRVAGFNGTNGSFNLRVDLAPPANDACASATVIGLGTTVGTNRAATNDGDTNCGGSSATTGKDVWYRFTPTCTNLYTIDTEGTTDLNDTVISVHSACPATPANTLACDDDSGTSFLSFLEVPLTAGTPYYIRVTGYAGSEGEFELNLSQLVSNDACGRPERVQTDVPLQFSNCGATSSTDNTETRCGFTNDAVGPDVWFVWNASCSGTATASVCGASFDTTMVVYNGICPGGLGSRNLGCNDDRCGDDSSVTWTVTEGANYLIRIGGATNGLFVSRGSGLLRVNCVSPCIWQSDDCYADYNDDGGIDSDDVIAYFQDWDTSASCADVNGDGGVDGDDVITFFGGWDAGGAGIPGC
ncbi:MAG: trypsin-like serine peptidase [Phycisphaerales bacterium]